MVEIDKPLLYKIVGSFIVLLNIIFIIIYCFEYSQIKCSSDFGDKLYNYMNEHNLDEYRSKLSNICPQISEGDSFGHGICLALITLIAFGFASFIIINYVYFIFFLINKNKKLIIISIIFFIAQIVIAIFSIYFPFNSDNFLSDKAFTDFGELGEQLRKAYDDFGDKMIFLRFGSILFLISSLFCLFAEIIIYQKSKNDNKSLIEQVEEVKDFGDASVKNSA